MYPQKHIKHPSLTLQLPLVIPIRQRIPRREKHERHHEIGNPRTTEGERRDGGDGTLRNELTNQQERNGSEPERERGDEGDDADTREELVVSVQSVGEEDGGDGHPGE